MQNTLTYKKYPLWIVAISAIHSLAVYSVSILVMLKAGLFAAIPYILLILVMEFRLFSSHCTNCYYFGKVCGFGKGRLSSFLFRRGKPENFCKGSFTWKDMVPDMILALAPIITAVILIIGDFNAVLLAAALFLVALATAGNGYVRGQLTCNHCIQREAGCPAEKLFRSEKAQ